MVEGHQSVEIARGRRKCTVPHSKSGCLVYETIGTARLIAKAGPGQEALESLLITQKTVLVVFLSAPAKSIEV